MISSVISVMSDVAGKAHNLSSSGEDGGCDAAVAAADAADGDAHSHSE